LPPAAAASLLIIPSFVTNVWQLLAGPNIAALASRLGLMMVGIVVGMIAGSWLMTKEDLIQALGLSFTVSTIALAIGLAKDGAFQSGDVLSSCLAVPPALLGMWCGQRMCRRVSPSAFRRYFLICLLILGVQLLLRPLI
jgi:hypothetical protein